MMRHGRSGGDTELLASVVGEMADGFCDLSWLYLMTYGPMAIHGILWLSMALKVP